MNPVDRLFDPAELERLQYQYPEIDVRAHAAIAADMAKRKTVHKPIGLLVSLVRKADDRRRVQAGVEHERYAEFWVWVLQQTSERQLGPGEVADLLGNAIAGGMTRINPKLPLKLRELCGSWPRRS